MGLDIWMSEKQCKTCGHQPEFKVFSCTYNLKPMWDAVCSDADRFIDIDGLTGKKAIPKLEEAVMRVYESRATLEKLNPENGWGNYDQFLKFLTDLLMESREHQHKTWVASR